MADEATLTSDPAGGDQTTLTSDPAVDGKVATDTAATDKAATDKVAGDKAVADKTEGDPDPAKGKAGDGEKTGAPDKYEDFTLPEGLNASADELKEFHVLLKDLNIPQKGAQQIVDVFSETLVEAAEAQKKAWADTRAEWKKTHSADKEIGGKNKAAQLGLAQSAIKKFGTAGLSEVLKATGLEDHPEVIRIFARMGKAIAEDEHEGGGTPSGGTEKTAAQTIYPSMAKKT